MDTNALLVDMLVNRLAEAVRRESSLLMPFKGALTQRWFGRFGYRWLCDVDLLVPPGEEAAHERALRGLGFEPAFYTPTTVTWIGRHSPISVDCHRRPFGPGLFRVETQGLVERSSVCADLFDAPIRRLDPYDAFLLMLGNAGKLLIRRESLRRELQEAYGRLALDVDILAKRVSAAHMRICYFWITAPLPTIHPLGEVAVLLRATQPERWRVAALRRLEDLAPGGTKSLVASAITDDLSDASIAAASLLRSVARGKMARLQRRAR